MSSISLKLRSLWPAKKAAKMTPEKNRISEEVMHLYRLRREHRLLRISAEGLGDSFQSMLLHIDLEQNHLILDEPFPNRRDLSSWVGRNLSVVSNESGLRTRFDSDVLGVDSYGGAPAIKLTMPVNLEATYPRRQLRQPTIAEGSVEAVVKIPGLGTVPVQVTDLSANGIRFALPGFYPSLEEGLKLCLRIGSESPLMSGLSVRNQSTEMAEQHAVTVVGAALLGLSALQAKTIERFMQDMQRTPQAAAS